MELFFLIKNRGQPFLQRKRKASKPDPQNNRKLYTNTKTPTSIEIYLK